MRQIILAAMLICSTNAIAEEFNLEFTNPTQIHHNSDDWATAARTTQFELFVNKSSIGADDHVKSIHTVVEFYPPDGANLEQLNVPVKRIYTHGVMECKNKIFHLLKDLFVDKHNQIVYTQVHPFGTYEVDVSSTDTPRNDLYQLVCSAK